MTFQEHRPRLLSLAYRILGSWSEAEDVVQDAFLRFERHPESSIQDVTSWLDRVVANLCLDVLKSSRVQREQYVGTWLPEPIPTQDAIWSHERLDPRTISLAFVALLERLSPLERAAYILAEAFDYQSEEIAQVLGKDASAVRQLLHRAREHVRQERVRFAPDKAAHEALLGAFATACAQGDFAALEKLLSKDVTLRSDGGGKAKAARNPIHGFSPVSRFLVGVAPKAPPSAKYEMREVNGWPALVGFDGEEPFSVVQVETDGAQIFSVLIVANPDKLKALRLSG